MNCCDASGRCTNGSNCATRHPAPLRFAPGVIEHTPRSSFCSIQQRRELRRWAGSLAAAVGLSLASIGAGLLVGIVWAHAAGA